MKSPDHPAILPIDESCATQRKRKVCEVDTGEATMANPKRRDYTIEVGSESDTDSLDSLVAQWDDSQHEESCACMQCFVTWLRSQRKHASATSN